MAVAVPNQERHGRIRNHPSSTSTIAPFLRIRHPYLEVLRKPTRIKSRPDHVQCTRLAFIAFQTCSKLKAGGPVLLFVIHLQACTTRMWDAGGKKRGSHPPASCREDPLTPKVSLLWNCFSGPLKWLSCFHSSSPSVDERCWVVAKRSPKKR